MDLSQLKREVEDLGNFEKKVNAFNRHWVKSNEYDFLNKEDKEQLVAFRKVIRELKYGQIVNEKIISLANNLINLQIHGLTNDVTEVARIRKRFVFDEHINIRRVIDEVNFIEFQLKLFKDFYERILYRLGKNLDLEGNLFLVGGKHYACLREMEELNRKQKTYLKEIGSKFVEMEKKL